MSETAESTSDGFQGTPASTRRRVRAIDAFIDLVLEGNLPPTTEQVAERAGISMATLFRYFENLNVMRRDAALRMLERFPLLHVSDVGKGPLRERIERFVVIRVALWEKVHLLARLQRSIVLQDPDAAQMVDFVRGVMADEVREHFAPELRRLTAARRDDAVALIASLTSVESWEQFRHAYGRSPLQTRRAWAQAIDAILSGGSER
ncbi:MAG: TetR/AcrR family transcriptional regulator [bacterium]|nr:TetR/AcrR family transcriptional regulator [bacterium]